MTSMLRIAEMRVCLGLALILLAGALGDAQAQTTRKTTSEATTSTERAASTRKTTSTSGVSVRGDKATAATGYVLEVNQNQVTARKAGGGPGGLGAALDCVCKYAHGACEPSSSGDQAVCVKTAGSPCGGKCEFVPSKPSGGATMTRGTTGVNPAAPAARK
jgi:hypothetical protein